jgi:hypothetical protein
MIDILFQMNIEKYKVPAREAFGSFIKIVFYNGF